MADNIEHEHCPFGRRVFGEGYLQGVSARNFIRLKDVT